MADRFHFLRLLELPLEVLARREVVDESLEVNRPAFGVHYSARLDVHQSGRAVFALPLQVERRCVCEKIVAGDDRRVLGLVPMHVFHHVPAHELFRLPRALERGLGGPSFGDHRGEDQLRDREETDEGLELEEVVGGRRAGYLRSCRSSRERVLPFVVCGDDLETSGIGETPSVPQALYLLR